MRYREIYIRARRYNDGEIELGDKAIKVVGNIQTPQNFRDIQLYGERITDVKKGVFRNSAVCKRVDERYPVCFIQDGDLAYIDTTPRKETDIGENADYVVRSVIVSNAFTTVVFEKIHQEV